MKDLLRKAKALIQDPKNWLQGTLRNDAATRFCALGAAYHVSPELPEYLNRAARLMGATRSFTAAQLNDTTDHATVMKLYDLAIEIAPDHVYSRPSRLRRHQTPTSRVHRSHHHCPTGEHEMKEKEFARAYVQHGKKLEALVKGAEQALAAAKALADEHGLPFKIELGVYVPASMMDKFYRIDPEFVETLTDIASYDFEAAAGWYSSSANC